MKNMIYFVRDSLQTQIAKLADEFRQSHAKVVSDVPTYVQETLGNTVYQNMANCDQKVSALHQMLQQLVSQVNCIQSQPPFDPTPLYNALSQIIGGVNINIIKGL
jgi:hypothetical protein